MAIRSLTAIWRGSLVYPCLAFGLFGCATSDLLSPEQRSQDPSFDFYTEHLESRGELARLGSVRIVNHWGDIRVRSSSGGAITVEAAIQRIGDPFPERPGFDVVEGGGLFALEVQYPDASLSPRTGRVDLVTHIPTGLAVSLETVDGTIDLKGTQLDLTAATESGDVFFVNEGSATVRSVSGDIHAAPLRPGWGELNLYSESGKVRANLPPGPGFEVRASGTDQIESDWPIVRDGVSHLIRLGEQGEERDRALITSGNAIVIRKVLSRPDPGKNQ